MTKGNFLTEMNFHSGVEELPAKNATPSAQVIDRSHMKLLELRHELESLSFLLCTMGPAEINGQLYGLGASLQRMSQRVEEVAYDLAKVPRS